MLKKMLNPFEEIFHKTVSNAYFKVRVSYAVIGTLLFSMAANGFAYFNLFPQFDSLNHVFRTAATWEVRLGRFLQPLYAKIRGQITMPWLIGILSMLFLMATVFLVCDMLNIDNKYQILLTAGFLSANVTITQMCAVFMYIDDICMAALMLATLGVWTVHKIRGWNGIVCAMICFALSMGLYQGYMVVAVIWFMVLVGKELMSPKMIWKELLFRWWRYIISVIAGVGIYYVIWQLALKIYDVEPSTGVNSVSQLKNLSLESLVEHTKTAYLNFMNFFVGNDVVLGTMAKYSTMLLFVLAVVAVFYYIRMKKATVYQYVVVGVLVICYPLVVLIMSIAMEKDNIDYLTSFGLCLVHPILLMLIFAIYCGKNKFESFNRTIAGVLSFVVLFANISFSNGAYTITQITYDRTLSVMTRVLEDIDAIEGYIPNETEVVIIGGNMPENISVFTDKYDSMRAFYPMSFSYSQNFKSFAILMGNDMTYTYDTSEIDMEYVKSMPNYPYEGYCQIVDGKMVVKFR